MNIREDQAEVTITLDGVQIPAGEVWATLSGGELTAADAKSRAGGMGKQKSYGGPGVRSDLTATIQFSDTIAALHKAWEQRVGKGTIEVTVLWLDTDAAALAGTDFKRTGTLKGLTEPNPTNSDSPAVGMYSLVTSCDEESPST